MSLGAKEQGFLNSAIIGAKAVQATFGILASITIAQAALESGWGDHMPPDSNNCFGIKALPGAPFVLSLTTEVRNGKVVWIHDRFAKYKTLTAAFLARAELLTKAERYQPAMEHKADAKAFAEALQACGYSTAPNYAASVMALVTQYNLTQYDRG